MSNSNQNIKTLIVGGGHGVRVHLPALRRVGFDVVGLVGRNLERTQAIADSEQIPNAFDCLEQAINSTNATVVTVASPPNTHAQYVLTAVERGLHVFCEKPFAKNMAEANRILAATERAGLVHMMGNQMRALPERIVATKAIADGLIGEPRFMTFVQHVNLVADPQAQRPDWWFDSNEGGGWLGASGSHLIDQIRSWLGEFQSLSASTLVLSDRTGVAEDSFDMRCTLVSGVEGVISQTGGSWGPNAMMARVMGTNGTLWIENGEAWIGDRDGNRKLPVDPALALELVEPITDIPRKRFLHIELPPTIRMFEAFKKAIENRCLADGYANFHDGLACMKVIDAARESAANQGARILIS